MKFRTLAVFALALVLTVFTSETQAKPSPGEQRAAIREMRDEVLRELYRLRPGLEKEIDRAAGYAVFSNVGVNLLIASFAGGHGIVVEDGLISDTETFMKMGSAGIGLGLGIKDFRAVFVFESKERLREFVAKGWDFGGQADAAAKSDKKGGSAAGSGSLMPGVAVYQLTKSGIALQATLQGTKYWKDKDLN